MIKLRVSARIIPESVYNAEDPPSTPSGRRFVVIVREPEQWYVGRLANEIKVNYRRLYKVELGQIKYLKDTEDNDLDPEQLVSDVFVNEGKAASDGHDQEAVIKVIQDERHAVRQSSVVPDLTPARYKPPSRPPVPKFNDVDSALGKRGRAKGTTGTNDAHPEKRARLEEVDETQNEDEVIRSVEQSPELIRNTQDLDMNDEDDQGTTVEGADADSSAQHRAPVKDDSESRKQLEHNGREAAKSPQQVRRMSHDRSKDRSQATDSTSEGGRTSSRRSELPLTPPTDASRSGSGSKKSPLADHTISKSAPPSKAAPPFSKFKASARRDVYALPLESDIEDSQMDKKTAVATTRQRSASASEQLDTKCSVLKTNGHRCNRALRCNMHHMAAKRAVAGRSEPFDDLLRKAKRGLTVSSPMPKPRLVATDVPPTEIRRHQDPAASSSTFDAEANLDPMDVEQEFKKIAPVARAQNADRSSTSVASESKDEDTSDEEDASKNGTGSKSGSSDASHTLNAASSLPPANTAGSIAKKRRRHAKQESPVDSPGQQLTQSLQESASKNPASEDVSQRLNSPHKPNGRSEPPVEDGSSEGLKDSRIATSSNSKKATTNGRATKAKKTLQDKLKDAKRTQGPKTTKPRNLTPEVQLADEDIPLPSVEKAKPSKAKPLPGGRSIAIAQSAAVLNHPRSAAAGLKTSKPVLPPGMTAGQYEQLVKQPARSMTPAEVRIKEFNDSYIAKERKHLGKVIGKSVSKARDSSSAIPKAAVPDSLMVPERMSRSSATPADDVDAITARLKKDAWRLSSPATAVKSSIKKNEAKKPSVTSSDSPSAVETPRLAKDKAKAPSAVTKTSTARSPSIASSKTSVSPTIKPQAKTSAKKPPKSAGSKPTPQSSSKKPTITKTPPTPLATAKALTATERPGSSQFGRVKDLHSHLLKTASKQSSPAPKADEKKRGFLLQDDTSSESDSSDDDEAATVKKPVIKKGESPRPDPSIRDRNHDESSSEEESSDDGAAGKKKAAVAKKREGARPDPTIRDQSSAESSGTSSDTD